MTTSFVTRRRWPWPIAITGFLIFMFAYSILRGGKTPVAPAVPVVTSCKKPGAGVRRIGRSVFQFDVPVKDFTISQFDADAPPVYGFRLKPRNGASFLDISWNDPEVGMESIKPLADPALTFSGPVEKRKILNDEGTTVGEDTWGYWGNGESWRRVRLRGTVVARYGSINAGDAARYGSVHQKEAELFDQIINSACIIRDAQ